MEVTMDRRADGSPPLGRILRAWRPTKDSLWAAALGALTLLIYLPTLSPSVVTADGGELQMIAARLGIAHPTGYPLFTLLGWVCTRLPWPGDAAYRVTLFCAVLTSATIALLYLVGRRLGAGRAASGVGALLAAFAPRVWMHASAAEVYALSSFFMVLTFWLLLRWRKGESSLNVVALAIGLGLTHHISFRLLGPAILIFVFAVQPQLWRRPRRWLPALGCMLAPLTIYAYIPLRAGQWLAQPDLSGSVLGVRQIIAAGLVSPHYFEGGALGLILALDYTGQILGGSGPGWRYAIEQLFSMAAGQFPLLVAPLAGLGIVALWRRSPKDSTLLLLAALANLGAALRFLAYVGEDGDHFIPVYLIFAIWCSVGSQSISDWLCGKLRAKQWCPTVSACLLLLLPTVSLCQNWPAALLRRQIDPAPAALLVDLPFGAVIAGDWKWVSPFRYRQQVEGVRTDLSFIHADASGSRLLLSRALEEDRPFYAIREAPGGIQLLEVPFSRPEIIGNPADLPMTSAVRWRGYDISPQEVRPGEAISLRLYYQVEQQIDQDWTTFIHVRDSQGERVAQVDRRPLGDLFPPTSWQAGDLIADPYEVELPSGADPGEYSIIWGWYSGSDRLVWLDGSDTHVLATVRVIAP
jgi:hypothetical protein